jgi:hypothetical protein
VVFVYKKNGRSSVKQQIVAGQSNENEIIIRAGLEVNDEVLLVPPDKAEDLSLNLLPADTISKYKEKPIPVKPQGRVASDAGKTQKVPSAQKK